MSTLTVHKVFREGLRLYYFKVKIVQVLDSDNRLRKIDFATDMLKRIEFLNFLIA